MSDKMTDERPIAMVRSIQPWVADYYSHAIDCVIAQALRQQPAAQQIEGGKGERCEACGKQLPDGCSTEFSAEAWCPLSRPSGGGEVDALLDAAESAEALIGVMFGRIDGSMPATINTPIGVPVKVAEIQRDLTAAIAALRANTAGGKAC